MSIRIASLLLCALAVIHAAPARADLEINSLFTPETIDFTGFTGTGFTPSPAAGQLDSDTWSVTGLSDGDLDFGDTGTSGDFARGSSSGGVTSGGVYAFDVGGGNVALGVQPAGSDFTPGEFILRISNLTGETVTGLGVSYDIFTFNNEGRSNSFNFSYSTNGVDYTLVPALDYTSPEAADSPAAWRSTARTTNITGLSVADSGQIYLKWTGDDVAGSGSRDEFALDNIVVTAVPEASAFLFGGLSLGAIGFGRVLRRRS